MSQTLEYREFSFGFLGMTGQPTDREGDHSCNQFGPVNGGNEMTIHNAKMTPRERDVNDDLTLHNKHYV